MASPGAPRCFLRPERQVLRNLCMRMRADEQTDQSGTLGCNVRTGLKTEGAAAMAVAEGAVLSVNLLRAMASQGRRPIQRTGKRTPWLQWHWLHGGAGFTLARGLAPVSVCATGEGGLSEAPAVQSRESAKKPSRELGIHVGIRSCA